MYFILLFLRICFGWVACLPTESKREIATTVSWGSAAQRGRVRGRHWFGYVGFFPGPVDFGEETVRGGLTGLGFRRAQPALQFSLNQHLSRYVVFGKRTSAYLH